MLELLGSAEFYETFDRYEPNENDYIKRVKKMAPSDWTFRRNGTWLGCNPPEKEDKPLPAQGWKIHVTSSVNNAEAILKAVVSVLIKDGTSFKFALDKQILNIMNGKAYGRQAAGKFITIYPYDDDHFKELIEKVHQVTRDFEGLYILSDRRYKDSKVVFYRYGGILPLSRLDITGKRASKIVSPDGEEVEDVRQPYFHIPYWTRDPFEDVSKELNKTGEERGDDEKNKDTNETKGESDSSKFAAPKEITLKDGRYIVKSALGYSNSGGVYIGADSKTGLEVVIKEARPFISMTENSIDLLKKEYRILNKLTHTGLFPRTFDIFEDWEHCFLVMEKLEGISLSSFSASSNITLKTSPTLEDTKKFYDSFRTIFIQLAEILKTMHENGIVFTDFSPNNVIVNLDTLDVRVIDFEGAYEIGIDKPVTLFTPGFAAPDQLSGQDSSFESDFFALGASMHYFLTPVNQIFAIYPKARYTFIKSVIKDIGFPRSLSNLIIELIDKSASKRPKSEEVIKILKKAEKVREPNFRVNKRQVDSSYKNRIKTIPKYIIAQADYSRTDRLFPADAAIFKTNPMSLAHGTAGVAYALNKMEGSVPKPVLDWILERNLDPALYPPGLYIGLAGIAWAMLEIGLRKESRKVMESTFEHPLLFESADLHYGIAGWGLANLKFFAELKDQLYLEKALSAGDFLVDNLSENEKGCFWESESGTRLGYFHGGSGISTFLLYLYLASGKESFLDKGIKALDFEINNSSPNMDGGASWKRSVNEGQIVYPYLKYGSAGVGTAIVRYYRLLEGKKYRDTLEKIYIDTNRKYAVFPGMFQGLSGLGEFLLDLYDATNDNKHLDAAYRVASGISLFTIDREEGVAFPGNGLQRISCDFGTGSAGVGLFMKRLVKGGKANFQLDELLPVKRPRAAALNSN